jgi:four helix bundle protein
MVASNVLRIFTYMIHKKLNVYIKSKTLVLEIYKLTSNLPGQERFNLGSQMRRASISILSNLAEGLVKSSKADKLRFIEIAYASLSELDTQIEISCELQFINKREHLKLERLCEDIAKMLSGSRKRIKSQT